MIAKAIIPPWDFDLIGRQVPSCQFTGYHNKEQSCVSLNANPTKCISQTLLLSYFTLLASTEAYTSTFHYKFTYL